MTSFIRSQESGYCGKRVKPSDDQHRLARAIGRTLFFPLLFFYLELVLHLHIRAGLRYFPIWLFFSMSAGFLMTAFTMAFRQNINRILAKVISTAVSLVYIIETIAKQVYTDYYPFSILGLAAGNRLTDYSDVVISTVIGSVPVILIMLLPAILLFVFSERVLVFSHVNIRVTALAAALVLVFHLLGLLAVHLPWKGDLTPAQLYKTDTNLNDQVEQLGLLTMLRRDIVHQIVPPDGMLNSDFTPSLLPPNENSAEEYPEEPADAEHGEEPVPSSAPVIDTSPNIMDIDLNAVADSAKSSDVWWLAQYFNSKAPTNKNAYTGMFSGYNVIFLTLEGFSGYAISEELTPTLYKLTHEGFVFKNFYTALHFTSTSGGECQNLLGLYPKAGNPATMNQTGALKTNCYFSLAQQLGRLGYTTMGYHANGDMYKRLRSHTNLGYDWRQSGSGFQMECSSSGKALWPQRDVYLINASVDDYVNSDCPFHIYYLTISGHMPYSNHWVVQQYRDLVDSLSYSSTTRNYVATCIEVDRALETLIARLDEAGKLDQTLIVAAPDHIPYADVEVLEELAGKKFGPTAQLRALNESNIDMDVYRNSLIMWSASMEEPVQVDKVCCQVDILPTVSNLLGLEYDSRLLSGSDILSNSEGQVVFCSQSWLTDKGYYNRFTQTFTPADGVAMTETEQEDYVSDMKKQVSNKLGCTPLILKTDFYDYLFHSAG